MKHLNCFDCGRKPTVDSDTTGAEAVSFDPVFGVLRHNGTAGNRGSS